MKKNLIGYMPYLFVLLVGLMIAIILFTACSKNNSYNGGDSAQTYTTSGNASGAQENPPNNSSGSGTLTGTYNASTNNWQYNINWSSLSSTATAVEVHGPASIGINGNLMFALTISTPGVNGNAYGNVNLTTQQEADFLAGKCYYTILSATHITGEIRGQINASAK